MHKTDGIINHFLTSLQNVKVAKVSALYYKWRTNMKGLMNRPYVYIPQRLGSFS